MWQFMNALLEYFNESLLLLESIDLFKQMKVLNYFTQFAMASLLCLCLHRPIYVLVTQADLFAYPSLSKLIINISITVLLTVYVQLLLPHLFPLSLKSPDHPL